MHSSDLFLSIDVVVYLIGLFLIASFSLTRNVAVGLVPSDCYSGRERC